MDFKKEIKKILKKMGINQTDLSLLVGVKPQQVTRWLSEQSSPAGKNKIKIIELSIMADKGVKGIDAFKKSLKKRGNVDENIS